MGVTVHVAIAIAGKPATLTTDAPSVATQSTTLGIGCSVPRNHCIAFSCMSASRYRPVPADCGYPAILGMVSPNRRENVGGAVNMAPTISQLSLNATATIHPTNASILVLTTVNEIPAGFMPTATSYGRGAWPMTVFFASSDDVDSVGFRGRNAVSLPVIPWYANFSVDNPWSPPLNGWIN